MVCQQLGLGSALEVRSFGPGSGPILLDDLECTGTESSLSSCSFIDRPNCNHNEDAGAVCSGTMYIILNNFETNRCWENNTGSVIDWGN